MKDILNQRATTLLSAILSLKDIKEAKMFFRDLLSEKEITELSKRWQVAQMLDKNIQYTKIQEATGLSSTTVARISKWLNEGMGGYRLILDRMKKNHHGKPVAVRSLR